MFSYSKAAVERAMKVQEVMLRAWAKKITWWQAAEILGISDRHLRRIREGYEKFGYFGLLDRRRGQPSPKRVPVATVEFSGRTAIPGMGALGAAAAMGAWRALEWVRARRAAPAPQVA